MPNNAPNVSVLGLGPMGSALARALVVAGYPITIWNRTPDKRAPLVAFGANEAVTSAEAVASSAYIVMCLADYAVTRAVLAAVDLTGKTIINLASGTPKEVDETAAWVADRGGVYLDGAIMVPPSDVGKPEAVFYYSGSESAFLDTSAILETFGGKPIFLGEKVGLAKLYNAALLGYMWASVWGLFHATALVGSVGVDARTFAESALDWFMPTVVSPISQGLAEAIDVADFRGDAGTLNMNLTAMTHLTEISQAQGVNSKLPELIRAQTQRVIAAGHGGDGFARLSESFRRPD